MYYVLVPCGRYGRDSYAGSMRVALTRSATMYHCITRPLGDGTRAPADLFGHRGYCRKAGATSVADSAMDESDVDYVADSVEEVLAELPGPQNSRAECNRS